MIKILHINDYPCDAGGGAEVVMRTTMDLLRGRGVRVEAFTSADLADARRTPWRYISNAHARRALSAKLDSIQPDVVHLHNYYHVLSPGILATLAERKRRWPLRVVMTAHDYHLACPDAGGSWFRWWSGGREVIKPGRISPGSLWSRRWDQRSWLHSLLKLAQHTWSYRWHRRHEAIDLVICPSRCVEATLLPLGLATCWLPHPVAVAPSRGMARAARLTFVFAGRIEPEKGLRELLQMWPADFPASLVVIGAGSQMTSCQAIAAERKLDVQFTGRLPHAQTLDRIARCHVLIQPSRVLETYGLTLIEALANGVNILAVQRGAARETIEAAGVGFLFELDNPASLHAQLHAIRRQHEAATLNRFDVSAFLAARSESRYVESLLGIYHAAPSSRLAA
jgi:glycosyltransferase involved in cell wall biosynthesis